MYKCGVQGLESYIGKKVNQEIIQVAKRQGSYAYGIQQQATVYFKPDGTITNFSGNPENLDSVIAELSTIIESDQL